MRIGIFTDSYHPHVSGVTTSIDMLKEALIKMGHKVFIVAPNLDKFKFYYDKDNEVIYLPGIKTGIYNTRFAEIYSRKAMKIIKNEWKLDIIHTQSEFGVGFFSKKVAKKLKLPIVHTYHTLYDDYVYYVTKGHFDKFAKKVVLKLTKYYCNGADELIVPTKKIKDLFNNKYGIDRDMFVIPTGIDIDRFYPNKSNTKAAKELRKKYKLDNTFVIGSVGRIAKEKCLDKILYNLKDLVKYNSNIRAMFVGDGPYLKELKKITKELNLEKYVIFTGLIDYNILPNYYQVIDAMVNFSNTETQGLTVIEGLASAKVVVCLNDPSFKEMVEHNYNGFLFDNDEEYKEYILNLMNDKDLYKNMCLNAKNSTYAYSKEVFASNLLKVYNKAIKKKTNSK